MAKKKPDYSEAQKLRSDGLSIKLIADITGLNRWGIGRNTTKKVQEAKPKNNVKEKVKSVAKPKLKKPKKEVRPIPNIDPSNMQKGHAKLKKDDVILENRQINPNTLRHVWVPFMNMMVSVKATDKRTDAQIVEFWVNKNKRDMQSLSTNPMQKPKSDRKELIK